MREIASHKKVSDMEGLYKRQQDAQRGLSLFFQVSQLIVRLYNGMRRDTGASIGIT